ncbi:HAD hydrolase IA REG-2-like protein [Wolfiporia cocos MD-104 SS10]|uniref:HAD hydrolase IA REG-2-like protein n=1 Tax=Wolfiporia cocos (strain MD-104) TaxID=742152 RepID=A0A2H3K542_WOLCO|nr:HAD hydrolase IA REG-2-like protein [Wolfiporia cocos MD-104 SS10]
MAIRLVIFDALQTLIAFRLPVYVQYAQTFEPHLGPLDPDAIKKSFKTALKQLQVEQPAYQSGAEGWWGEVIRRTAVGAGADHNAVGSSLPELTRRLLHRFSSREGYRAFDDALPTLQRLREAGIRTGVVSNADARMHTVLVDLGLASYLDEILLSDEERMEKPAREIFLRACARIGVRPNEALHVGDELQADYHGACGSGLSALLVRRPGPDGMDENKEPDEDLTGVQTVPGLAHVVEWVRQREAEV